MRIGIDDHKRLHAQLEFVENECTHREGDKEFVLFREPTTKRVFWQVIDDSEHAISWGKFILN
jgi:hypothetical protein